MNTGKFLKGVLYGQTTVKIEFELESVRLCGFDCLERLLLFLDTLQISH